MSTLADPTDQEVAAHAVELRTADGEQIGFDCAGGQTVLDAAAAAGVTLPASCRQGTCGSCHATVSSGAYALGTCSPSALPVEQRERGEVLLCRTYPRGPVAVTLPYDGSRILRGEVPEREAYISALEPVARDTVRLELKLCGNDDGNGSLDCQFEPGQFMELKAPGREEWRAYSLANTGNWEGRMEFFIRLREGGVFSTYLREHARLGRRLWVRGPQGAFGLRETGLRPRWFVGGGTGLAPLLAMVRHMAEWQEPQPARLFFGVTEESDLFGLAELDAVAGQLPDFRYEVCVWRPGPASPRPQATPADAVAAAADRWDASATPDLYLCGPPPMIDAVSRAATAATIPAEHIISERLLPS